MYVVIAAAYVAGVFECAGKRDRETQGLFSYITVERVSFALYKSHSHFYFRWLHVPRDWRKSVVR